MYCNNWDVAQGSIKGKWLNCILNLLEQIQSNKVITAIFHGIGHNNDELNEKQISKLVDFKSVKNIEVKHALISALSELENGDYGTLLLEAIGTLNDNEFVPLLKGKLMIAKANEDDIASGWVLALEGTIE
jgi:hypothetical protein